MGATTSHRRGYGTGYSGQSIQPQNILGGGRIKTNSWK